jgi:phosphoenolpyruvate carboxylase
MKQLFSKGEIFFTDHRTVRYEVLEVKKDKVKVMVTEFNKHKATEKEFNQIDLFSILSSDDVNIRNFHQEGRYQKYLDLKSESDENYEKSEQIMNEERNKIAMEADEELAELVQEAEALGLDIKKKNGEYYQKSYIKKLITQAKKQ